MRSQRSRNFRAKERAVQLQRAFLYDLVWLAFLVAISIIFLPSASHAGDFQTHVQRLSKLDSQIIKSKDELHELGVKRSLASSGEEKEAIHKQMAVLYNDLQKYHDELNDIKTHIRFKHPEQGDVVERKYSHQSLQPLSTFETDTSLDGKLDSFLGKMHGVYGEQPKGMKIDAKTAAKNPKSLDPRAPASAEAPKKKVFNPDDVDQSITLSK